MQLRKAGLPLGSSRIACHSLLHTSRPCVPVVWLATLSSGCWHLWLSPLPDCEGLGAQSPHWSDSSG